MKYLALAVLFTVMQAPPPAPRKAADTSISGSRDIKKNTDAKQHPSTQALPAPDTKKSDNDKNPGTHPTDANAFQTVVVSEPAAMPIPHKDWWEKAYVIFTGLLVLVGALGVGYAIRTLRAVEQQGRTMEGQNRILTESVSAANRGADAADKNASSLANIERAWLVVDVSVPRTLSENIPGGAILQGVGFTWIVRNCGKTSAFITKIGARFHAVKAFSALPLEPDIDAPGVQAAERYASGVPIGPGEKVQRCRMLEGENRHPNATEEKLIMDGALTYLGYGVVEYKTVLDDKIHRSWFCHRWLPSTNDPFPPSPIPANYTQYT